MLLANLSFLSQYPTGLSVYAINLLRSLPLSDIQVLSNHPIEDRLCHGVPSTVSSDRGHYGTMRRLWWTQSQLPTLASKLNGSLLFSPIPEAPLGSQLPVVVTVHDVIPLRFPKRVSFLRLYFRHYVARVVEEARHVICDSEATACDLKDILGVSARSVSVIPLAFDCDNFYPLYLPPKNYFLYVGRHDNHKNLGRLIQAFSFLKNKDLELKIAGSFDSRNTPILQQQVQELGLRDRVQFLSYVAYSDLPKLMNEAIALVFPSLWEGFGLPVLEAMACGTPVITSNCSSLPEVTGDAAILIDPYNVSEIADAMQTLSDDGQLWQSLHHASLARSQQFSWQKTAATTAKVLSQYTV